MPVIFCYIDPFDMRQQVVKLSPNDTTVLFNGTIDEVIQGMITEYSSHEYDRIVLKGIMADEVADRMRETSRTTYGIENIEIEVLD